ncbi:glycosyl hydrolase catalytic core-domain-containing protein [Staphylotrichum tortipilum]|uniref:Glycosyl hydrolase catalytic core-domain-containing protein n=1 Tax=Staphylotrichum tortipilum TaxID=2831512 RepID=A0AAN6MGN9_9PEZI|nr:glycosyl hydrolase catalytic core-domain-containing protein [Staphylotrichum longicolle]
MHSKTLLALAAAGASLVGQAIAGPRHLGLQHGVQHGHHEKRALVTQKVTVTDWVTVTVTEGETATTAPRVFVTQSRKRKSTSTSKSSSSTKSTTTSSAVVAPPAATPASSTTLVTLVSSSSKAPAVQAVPSSTSVAPVVNTPAPPPPPAPTSTSTSQAPVAPPPAPTTTSQAPAAPPAAQEGNGSGSNTGGSTGGSSAKRGLAYNDPQLLTRFLNGGNKVSWAYNWGQYDDSGTSLEFCPMLWGLKLDFAQTWPANAQKAINAGSKCLFSFNEPDLGSQANMSPQLAAQKHIELMNPFSGKALIGAPAITNSGASNQGIAWLKQFFDACGGKCAVDFVNIHIYGVDTTTFLTHLRNVRDAFNKPVWITEFAFDGSDDQIDAQLKTVIHEIETNPTYSFVQRYSYFMAGDGHLVKGNSVSSYGNTFAYGA